MTSMKTFSTTQKTALTVGVLYLVIAVAAGAIFRDAWCLPLVLCNKTGIIALDGLMGIILVITSFLTKFSRPTLQVGSLLLLTSAIIGYLPGGGHLFVAIFGLAPTTPINFINLVAGTSAAIVSFELFAEHDN